MLREESTCLNRYKLPDELHAVCFHVGSDLFCHFLVKAPQKNGTHHHSDIQTQASQKPCTLQSHVGSTHNQSLARAVRQGEEVITENRRSLSYKVLPTQACLTWQTLEQTSSVFCAFSSHLVMQNSLSPGIPRYLGLSPVASTKVSAVW